MDNPRLRLMACGPGLVRALLVFNKQAALNGVMGGKLGSTMA